MYSRIPRLFALILQGIHAISVRKEKLYSYRDWDHYEQVLHAVSDSNALYSVMLYKKDLKREIGECQFKKRESLERQKRNRKKKKNNKKIRSIIEQKKRMDEK